MNICDKYVVSFQTILQHQNYVDNSSIVRPLPWPVYATSVDINSQVIHLAVPVYVAVKPEW